MEHAWAGQRRPAAQRPTLAQVAALAEVSLKTASRALNGEPYVAEPTRARVAVAADRLGFRLNGLASQLRRGTPSAMVGMVSGDPTNPFCSAVAGGVERELRDHGLHLVISSTADDPDREPALVGAFLERRVHALLIMALTDRHEQLVAGGTGGVPLVFLDRPAVGPGADAVVIDNRGGGRQAGEHLLAGGHRRITVVGCPDRYPAHRERLAGFAEAMAAAGNRQWRQVRCRAAPAPDAAAPDAAAPDAAGPDAAGPVLAGALDADPAPTALFTLDSRHTAAALRALGAPGTPEPPGTRVGRPAIVGFDDFDLGDVLGITVVRYDGAAMGRQAARLAVRRAGCHSAIPRTVTMQTHIVSRGSGEISPGH